MTSTRRIIATVATAWICFAQGVCLAAAAPSPVPDTLALADCNWNHPGANPFMGDVVAAVDRYQDIPAPVRARLKARMAKRDYDEVVEIRRDAINGRDDYASEISDMHFGTRQLCHRVTRAAWTPQMQERGLVYCEQGQCILVPTVCRNVSRIQRRVVHNQPMHSLFVPGPAADFASAADADGPARELAGPIGWAPGGFAAPLAAGAGGEAGPPVALAFATATGGGGGTGSAAGLPSGIAAASAQQSDLTAGERQSARVIVATNEQPGTVDIDQPVPAAPVPEPQTWALMAIGLVGLARATAVRRRPARATC